MICIPLTQINRPIASLKSSWARQLYPCVNKKKGISVSVPIPTQLSLLFRPEKKERGRLERVSKQKLSDHRRLNGTFFATKLVFSYHTDNNKLNKPEKKHGHRPDAAKAKKVQAKKPRLQVGSLILDHQLPIIIAGHMQNMFINKRHWKKWMFTQVSAQDLVLTEMVKWRALNLWMNFIVVITFCITALITWAPQDTIIFRNCHGKCRNFYRCSETKSVPNSKAKSLMGCHWRVTGQSTPLMATRCPQPSWDWNGISSAGTGISMGIGSDRIGSYWRLGLEERDWVTGIGFQHAMHAARHAAAYLQRHLWDTSGSPYPLIPDFLSQYIIYIYMNTPSWNTKKKGKTTSCSTASARPLIDMWSSSSSHPPQVSMACK